MSIAHILGFPRIGANRELKKALEAYWKGEVTEAQLRETGYTLRSRHWEAQHKAGMDFVTVGDFSFYDQVLDTSALLGVVPRRFDWHAEEVDLDTYFRMARGVAPTGAAAPASEMTKWFDTNYHYLVPEFDAAQSFRIACSKLFNEVTVFKDALPDPSRLTSVPAVAEFVAAIVSSTLCEICEDVLPPTESTVFAVKFPETSPAKVAEEVNTLLGNVDDGILPAESN